MGESKTTRIMMATVPQVTSGLGLRTFQADGFLLTRVYSAQLLNSILHILAFDRHHRSSDDVIFLFLMQVQSAYQPIFVFLMQVQSVYQPTNALNKINKKYISQNAIHGKYQTATYFGTGRPSAGSLLGQKNTRSTRRQITALVYLNCIHYIHILYIYIQGVPGGMDKTSGGCSLF